MHFFEIRVEHLQHESQFLAEERRQRLVGGTGQVDRHAAPAGHGHLGEGDDHAAVRAVVAGQQLAVGDEGLEGREGPPQALGVVQVGAGLARLVEDLGQRAAAEPVASATEVDQQQGRGAGLQVGRDRQARVRDRREGRDDQTQRRMLAVGRAIAASPARTHRERVLADGDGDAQTRTEIVAHGLDRVVERGVFALLAAGAHPVGR